MSTELLDAALAYAAQGWRVFPCGTDKKPRVSDWPNAASTDPETIRAWWTKDTTASIGCPTGALRGAWVLDVDLPEGPSSLVYFEAKHGPLQPTLEQRTGGGGRQLFFKWAGVREVRNSVKKLAPGLDVRGEGGYVILPPSGHPSGNKYAWVSNETPIAEAPGWLLDMVALLPKPNTAQNSTPLPAHVSATSAYGRKALEDECGKVASTPEGSRNDQLNRSAFALGQLVAGGELDNQEAEAALLNAVLTAGLPEIEAQNTIASGMTAGELEPRSKPELFFLTILDGKETVAPVSFDTPNVPEVDPTALPQILGEFCGAVTEGLQVPFELVLINALACVAVAGQRKFKVQVRSDYFETVNIYALAALPPGERKSATVEVCKRPLLDWEAAEQEWARENIRKVQSERKTLEKVIEAKRTKAGHAKPEALPALIEEIKQLEARLPEVPASPRLLIDDVTPEAIPVFLECQQERAGIIEAEGGLFETLAGRYSKGVPNLDTVLKAWSGESVHVDRKIGLPIALSNPTLTICLSPQPEIIRSLADKPGFRGRGLLGRFLYLMPRSRVGSRKVEPQPIPQAVQDRYEAKVRVLLNLPWAMAPDGMPTCYHLKLELEAYREWLEYYRGVEASLRPGGELELIADWGGKLPGAAARLAGLLHLMEHDDPITNPIGLGTMKQAMGLATVFTEHAKAAFALMGADPNIECAKHILTWIQGHRIEEFKARDAFQAVKGRYLKMEMVKAGLSILEERAYIFRAKVPEDELGKAGRPASPGYIVNPLTFGGCR